MLIYTDVFLKDMIVQQYSAIIRMICVFCVPYTKKWNVDTTIKLPITIS